MLAFNDIDAVVDAWVDGVALSRETCSTDGETLWSHGLPIGKKVAFGGDVLHCVPVLPRSAKREVRAHRAVVVFFVKSVIGGAVIEGHAPL